MKVDSELYTCSWCPKQIDGAPIHNPAVCVCRTSGGIDNEMINRILQCAGMWGLSISRSRSIVVTLNNDTWPEQGKLRLLHVTPQEARSGPLASYNKHSPLVMLGRAVDPGLGKALTLKAIFSPGHTIGTPVAGTIGDASVGRDPSVVYRSVTFSVVQVAVVGTVGFAFKQENTTRSPERKPQNRHRGIERHDAGEKEAETKPVSVDPQ